MFERAKKGDEASESPDKSRPESDKSFGTLRSKATSRNNEMAVIGSSIQINGDLRGDEDLRIEGKVSGTVELKNSVLTIGKEGKVKADVYAKSIAVDGETKGDLYATERVSVAVGGHVHDLARQVSHRQDGPVGVAQAQHVPDREHRPAIPGELIRVARLFVGDRAEIRRGRELLAADRFQLTVRGRQTHGAMPWNGVDPIVVAAQVVLGLQTIASRQVDVTLAPSINSMTM